jgi:predicted choloylglycine hydrolase
MSLYVSVFKKCGQFYHFCKLQLNCSFIWGDLSMNSSNTRSIEKRQLLFVFLVFFLAFREVASTAEPFRYPEDHYGKGQLRYINELPVLSVKGSPEEMGEQIGRLALKPAHHVPEALRDFFRKTGHDRLTPLVTIAAKGLFSQFPDAYRREIEAMVKAAEVDRDTIIIANTFLDLGNLIGCSSLLVDSDRSTSGGPLFGRNLDFAAIDSIAEGGLIIIYHPTGKAPYAIATFPGLLATGNGMNDSGLAMATQAVMSTADGSGSFNPKGTAIVVALRQGFEECHTVDEVEKWLKSHPLATRGAVAVCDSHSQAIMEITTKTVAIRKPTDGICCGTNHFRLPGLATNTNCYRFDQLEKSRLLKQLSVDDVARLMNDASAGKATIQTMVFEPAKLRMHVSLGKGPTSSRPLKTLELEPLFKSK